MATRSDFESVCGVRPARQIRRSMEPETRARLIMLMAGLAGVLGSCQVSKVPVDIRYSMEEMNANLAARMPAGEGAAQLVAATANLDPDLSVTYRARGTNGDRVLIRVTGRLYYDERSGSLAFRNPDAVVESGRGEVDFSGMFSAPLETWSAQQAVNRARGDALLFPALKLADQEAAELDSAGGPDEIVADRNGISIAGVGHDSSLVSVLMMIGGLGALAMLLLDMIRSSRW